MYLTIAALAVLAATGGYIAYSALQRIRHRKWLALAKRLGFDYRDKHYEWAKRFPFRLFDFGVRSYARNLVWSKTDTGSVAICDFGYWTRHWLSQSTRSRSTMWASGGGGAKGTAFHRSHWQTVVVIESSALHSPMVFMRRERVIVDWIKEKFGEPDVDFTDDKEFSDAYVVQGLVESEIRRVLSRRVRALLTQYSDTAYSVEINGPFLMVNCGRRIDPDACDEVLTFAIGLEKLLREYDPVDVAPDAPRPAHAAGLVPGGAVRRPATRGKWGTGTMALVIVACAALGGLAGVRVLHAQKDLAGVISHRYARTTYREFSPARALVGFLVGGALGALTGLIVVKGRQAGDPTF